MKTILHHGKPFEGGLYRTLRRPVRKVLKPICLWINECRYQESEHEVSRLDAVRADACLLMQSEYRRQVELQMQRNQIAGW